MHDSVKEKCPFTDTVWGFALKLFGILLFANVLSQIFTFVAGLVSQLLGTLLTDILVSGMGLMIFVTSVYQVAWNKGFRDIGLVSRDMITYNPKTGLYAGLIASIPGVLLYLAMLITAGMTENLAAFPLSVFGYKLIHSHSFLLVEMLAGCGAFGPVLCIVFLIPLPLIAWMGYVWGYRNKLVSKSVMYGKNDPNNSAM